MSKEREIRKLEKELLECHHRVERHRQRMSKERLTYELKKKNVEAILEQVSENYLNILKRSTSKYERLIGTYSEIKTKLKKEYEKQQDETQQELNSLS